VLLAIRSGVRFGCMESSRPEGPLLLWRSASIGILSISLAVEFDEIARASREVVTSGAARVSIRGLWQAPALTIAARRTDLRLFAYTSSALTLSFAYENCHRGLA
jgi:hypothetical protein